MTRRVLNVGGNSRAIRLPAHFDGWEQHLLDIDPKVRPDILCDAREMLTLPGGNYDAIYCSHNLEHYFRHELPKVLAGFNDAPAMFPVVVIIPPTVSPIIRPANPGGALSSTATPMMVSMSRNVPIASANIAWA